MRTLCLRLFAVVFFIADFAFTFAQLPAYLPTNGLVAWYPFNGNANDESGNGNDGVLGNVLAWQDRFGQQGGAFKLNNSSIQLGSNIKVLNSVNYTIGAWIKLNQLEETWMFSQRSANGYEGTEVLIEGNEIWPFYGATGNNFQWMNLTPNGISMDEFHLIICVIDKSNGQLSLYIDGYMTGSYPISSITQVQNSVNAFIGKKATSNTTSTFIVDEFFFYNRALIQSEITSIKNLSNLAFQQVNTSPPGIPYQAEVRNEGGEILPNANVNVRFTLHELTANGTVSYQETHAVNTNELGLFAATIGAGTATQGTIAGINWSQTTKFLKVEVDTGNGYITMGNQQLMSVPYALYAANGPAGPQGPVGPQGPAGAEGQPGANGLSAYEVWLAQGNSGSESDFLQTLSNNSSPSNLGFTVFTQSGTFTVPQGVTEILVEAWGGGGGGGGTCAQSTARYGGGGGAGAYIKTRVSVTPLETYTVNVGQGGQGGQGVPFQVYGIGSNGQNGTPTCMGNIVCAAGGNGGTGGNCDFGTGSGIVGAGGQGGSCSAGAMICNPGAPGSSGTTTQPGSGGSGHNQFINGIYNIGAGGSAQQPGQQGAIIIQY